jgi:hypothetical protein
MLKLTIRIWENIQKKQLDNIIVTANQKQKLSKAVMCFDKSRLYKESLRRTSQTHFGLSYKPLGLVMGAFRRWKFKVSDIQKHISHGDQVLLPDQRPISHRGPHTHY